ncbi:amidohydrolase/deacetylase family metallohydrolase [Parasedimentitalea psychrophila]|uniref:Amidohydrolase/deacetylase family metallohydrolase n=1 Tax=Parasedimentitalea psychrophila TaxID=2997337 RepID=A0A9Y2P794_9RHOB|nr:amidohydrolase/deacetylase family metallohydrolase [Parasedimentitalea psychrophila]WIY25803.1 amidohydrolase/deacetylase family metallohydrolase [Parasedimentitalea psychrophila]
MPTSSVTQTMALKPFATNDFVIKGGHVMAFDGQDADVMDVRVSDGRIVELGAALSGEQVIDASGAIVTPGLIDIHTHIYRGATSLSVPHEKVAIRSSVGTFVDAGSAGGGNIDGFEEFIQRSSQQNIFAYLNISFPGIFGFSKNVMVGEAEDVRLLSKIDCIEAAKRHPDLIVGIKVRAGKMAAGENGAKALEVALEVAQELGLPIMCHVDYSPPDIEHILKALRPGDILTHCCRPDPNSVVTREGVMQAAWQAKKRGVFFDIGHGMGGFSFEVCRQMLAQGFVPDIISSDIHCLSVDGPAFDLLTTINKIITLGVSQVDAIKATTQTPARAIFKDSLGRIRVGDTANISVLKPDTAENIYVDAVGEKISSTDALRAAALVAKGSLICCDRELATVK